MATDIPDFTDWFAERMRSFRESGAVAATPRAASTVVLLRDADPGLEVFAIRRATTMVFAGGMYAFPGGSVDPADGTDPPPWSGPSTVDWSLRLGLAPAQAVAVVTAAARELFEEAGVLLAGPDPSTVVDEVGTEEWERGRAAVDSRDRTFAELLRTRDLRMRSDLLVPWARWVTPEFEPRRFDTYFFIARMPAGQRTRQIGGEAEHTRWVRPAELGDGTHKMLPPTIVTLRELAAFSTVDEAIGAAMARDTIADHTIRSTGRGS